MALPAHGIEINIIVFEVTSAFKIYQGSVAILPARGALVVVSASAEVASVVALLRRQDKHQTEEDEFDHGRTIFY